MLSKLINKVYVINLKSCSDRKEHIKQLFNQVKINNYEIFEAIDKNSLQVQNMMKSDFVKKFPPCFRCNKNKCKCSNNVLINTQIGNWCSFINIMNDIIKNNYKGLIMICEDDIKFIDNGMEILNKMISTGNLKKYNVDFKKPILIRTGSGFNLNHKLKHKPKLIKKVIMSNPCFICNKYYAKSFIRNLKVIDTTSDIYIHKNILSLDKSIQAYTLLPQPIYELSWGKNAKFISEIHPKGNHFKRIEYKEYLKNKTIFTINNSFKMYVPFSKTDGIFISLRKKNTWESNVTKLMLKKFNQKNIDTFIDIGANIGYYTLLFARKNIKTYSFEPNLENYDILSKNLKINNFNNSIIYNLGLSDSIGELKFYYSKEKSGHGSFNKNIVKKQNLNLCKKIKVDKLDNINIEGENIMLKIDIEGFELNAINGMLKLLDSTKIKVFCIEISRKFYGIEIEKKIINLLKKYFTKLYIVQLKKRLLKIPHLSQYDLICS
jgi:FkbM family methyltransferase